MLLKAKAFNNKPQSHHYYR